MERRLEIVKNNGNLKSKFTITPERLTIKLRDKDLDREDEIVALGQKVASQVPLDEVAIRGSLSNNTSDRVKLNSGSLSVTYLFSRASGELQRIRRSNNHDE